MEFPRISIANLRMFGLSAISETIGDIVFNIGVAIYNMYILQIDSLQ